MPQRIHAQSNAENVPTAERKKQEPPVDTGSPDDPIGVRSPGTGKPGRRPQK